MISPSLLPPLPTKKHPAAAGCFRHSLWGLFHFLQVRQETLSRHWSITWSASHRGRARQWPAFSQPSSAPRRQETEAKLPSASRRISPAA